MQDLVKYEQDGQTVEFTAKEVKDRLCPNIDDKELALVMSLCQSQKLNPFIKDVYIIKYGNNPATIVTSKEVFTKRAAANPKFEGMEAGISVMVNGELKRRDGSMLLDGEKLVGGWCRVYVSGYRAAMFDEVSFKEYSTGKSGWSKMPATMIRKVAICHALREAFPSDFQGLYGAEEMGADKLDVQTQNPPAESVSEVLEEAGLEYEELASDEQLAEIQRQVQRFAELCAREPKEVIEALRQSSALKGERLEYCTKEQAIAALNILESWIAKKGEYNER